MNSPRSAISQSTCIFLPSRRSVSHIFCLLRWGINQWKTAEPWAALGNSGLRAAACTVVHSSANNVKAWCWCNSTGPAFLEQPSSTSCLGPPSSLGYTHGHRTRKGQALSSNGQRRIWGSSVLGLGMPLSFLTWERVLFTETPTHPVAGHYCFGDQGPSFNTLFRRISPFSSVIRSARSRAGLAQACPCSSTGTAPSRALRGDEEAQSHFHLLLTAWGRAWCPPRELQAQPVPPHCTRRAVPWHRTSAAARSLAQGSCHEDSYLPAARSRFWIAYF